MLKNDYNKNSSDEENELAELSLEDSEREKIQK